MRMMAAILDNLAVSGNCVSHLWCVEIEILKVDRRPDSSGPRSRLACILIYVDEYYSINVERSRSRNSLQVQFS